MIQKEKILDKLYNDEISFSDAMGLLKISRLELDELMGTYVWTPPLEKINKVSELEKKSIGLINKAIDAENRSFSHNKKQYEMKPLSSHATFKFPCVSNPKYTQEFLIPSSFSINSRQEFFELGRSIQVTESVYEWN